jgi:large subunit ribosomal protein L20
MARVKRAVNSRKGRRKILERAQGFKGSRSPRLRAANEQVMNAMGRLRRQRTRRGLGGCGSPRSMPRPVSTAPRTRG